MHTYTYQACHLGDDGAFLNLCHERSFVAADDESAIITAEALHEVLKAAEHCNAIRVLNIGKEVLWTRNLALEVMDDPS